MVYGKSSASKGIGAGEIIKGKYTDEDNKPDRDLGKSITPGFRNISFEVSSKKLLKICGYIIYNTYYFFEIGSGLWMS